MSEQSEIEEPVKAAMDRISRLLLDYGIKVDETLQQHVRMPHTRVYQSSTVEQKLIEATLHDQFVLDKFDGRTSEAIKIIREHLAACKQFVRTLGLPKECPESDLRKPEETYLRVFCILIGAEESARLVMKPAVDEVRKARNRSKELPKQIKHKIRNLRSILTEWDEKEYISDAPPLIEDIYRLRDARQLIDDIYGLKKEQRTLKHLLESDVADELGIGERGALPSETTLQRDAAIFKLFETYYCLTGELPKVNPTHNREVDEDRIDELADGRAPDQPFVDELKLLLRRTGRQDWGSGLNKSLTLQHAKFNQDLGQ